MFCSECIALFEQLEMAGRKLTAAAMRDLHGTSLDRGARQQHLTEAFEMNQAVRIAYETHVEHCQAREIRGAN